MSHDYPGPSAGDSGPSARDAQRSRLPSESSNGRPPRAAAVLDLGGPAPDAVEAGVERLREEARRIAREDAECGVPAKGSRTEGPTESETELKDRCIAFFERWHSRERRKLNHEVADREERIAEGLGRIELGNDRFQRIINELIRLRARFEIRRTTVAEELNSEGQTRGRGISTRVYVSALVFLGLVEFFANAPVFSALLPRDPLTERQIRLLTEASAGWLVGLERVGAHIVFRPDAALLAAGVITFLCVLAHFFGHSLRDMVMQGERNERRHTVQSRSMRENVVPLVLSAIGLILTLGVLYESRVQLGQVGQERYDHDMTQVEELRRQAGWLRVDGEILQGNELSNRAEDTEAAAAELREYSLSMARMNFPILLLNLTLVLCAISAAYFHRRDGRREQFNETPFEDERRALTEQGEACSRETSTLLTEVTKDVRALKTATLDAAADETRAVIHQLESVLATYRSENGRARGMDPRSILAFRNPIRLDLEAPRGPGSEGSDGTSLTLRDPDVYERERAQLADTFQGLRARFNEEATTSW